jgi:hypothetical protein
VPLPPPSPPSQWELERQRQAQEADKAKKSQKKLAKMPMAGEAFETALVAKLAKAGGALSLARIGAEFPKAQRPIDLRSVKLKDFLQQRPHLFHVTKRGSDLMAMLSRECMSASMKEDASTEVRTDTTLPHMRLTR